MLSSFRELNLFLQFVKLLKTHRSGFLLLPHSSLVFVPKNTLVAASMSDSSWMPQSRRLSLFVSHVTIHQIFDDEYAVGLALREHSSLVSVMKSPLLAVRTFGITDRSPLRRMAP